MSVNFNNDNNINRSELKQKREGLKRLNKDISLFKPQYVSQNDSTDSISDSMGARFDGVIGDTMQSFSTGDCWVLAGVNSLNQTDWGQAIIKNTVKSDGQGGAIVSFKGAEGSQKEFHITVEDLRKAEQSDKYSAGDSDMTAIELAVEKYADLKVKDGNLDKTADTLLDGGIGITMQELLTGVKPHFYYNGDTKLEECFDKIQENPGEYSIYTAFLNDAPPLYKDHAYTLKTIEEDINGNKKAVLINPWDSSEIIDVPFDKFKSNMHFLLLSDNPDSPDENLKSNYDLQKEIIEARLLGSGIKKNLLDDNEQNLKKELGRINKDNVAHLLKFYPSIITMLDSYKSGWGNGKAKKELILPIINAVI